MKTAHNEIGETIAMVITKGSSCGKSVGAKIVFGSKPPLPMRGFPEGKIRVRARNTDFLRVRVRTECGIREYYVKEVDGYWEPAIETGFNSSNVGRSHFLVIDEQNLDDFISACVPGGESCDPQIIADSIREYFSANNQNHGHLPAKGNDE